MAKPIRKKLEVQHDKSTFQIKLKQRLLIGAIILYTFLLFSKTLTNDFVNWDDPFYLQQNMLIQDLSWNNIVKIFKTPVIGMYNPLTFITFAIEHHFWKFDPHPYHFFNLLFHLINVWLVFIFICRLTKNINAAAIVALLFAIHPLHVGAVAWVSQRKTVLFAIFYFLALIEYLKFIESDKKTKKYILIILYFILSLLSKPSAVSLPLILLLIDYYIGRKYTLKTLIEKIPF
ncbi:MAG: glycosyltransferase family 39 protein, partial [Bacteroidales bacterium]|nr:glycosyltransferase family 39 protein [Bacteroidales bacterium]